MPSLDRSVTLAVKVTPADAEAIKEAAARAEMSVSEYMRGATLVVMMLDGNAHAMRMLVRGALRMTVDVWERIRRTVVRLEEYRSAVAKESRGDRAGA